jgi:hypothetical protein
MLFTPKTIAQQLSDEIKLNPLNLEKFDELYNHYFNQNNGSGMEVVREGRYQALLKIYPEIVHYASKDKFIQKDYFESDKRLLIEEYFFEIKRISSFNPSKSYQEILERSEQYLNLQNNFLEHIYIAYDLSINNDLNDLETYESFRLHFYVATKYLIKMSKLLMELDMRMLNRDYQLQFQKFFTIIKEAKEKIKYSKLIQIFMPTAVTDKEVLAFIQSNSVIRRLLRR